MQIEWTLEIAKEYLREWIDFKSPAYNRPLGRELLAKAFGKEPGLIWDLTLGFAEDAWTLVRLGYQVRGFERDKWLYECVRSVYAQFLEGSPASDLAGRLELVHADSWDWLHKHPEVFLDSCYLDPMFFDEHSLKKISAQPRKPIQALRYWLSQAEPPVFTPSLAEWIEFLRPRVGRRLVVKVHKSVIHQLPKPRFLVSGNKMQWLVYDK
ncbi:MAG: class I SAM-dependent methyltransferase [Bdellovibrionaceae bacterium]|jgi:hypothetical protein|nr:class I SAM-dependent methyltransferase [Pseudobdellovibrionaceae bacterium]